MQRVLIPTAVVLAAFAGAVAARGGSGGPGGVQPQTTKIHPPATVQPVTGPDPTKGWTSPGLPRPTPSTKPDLAVQIGVETMWCGSEKWPCYCWIAGFTVSNLGVTPAENVMVRTESRDPIQNRTTFTPCAVYSPALGPGRLLIQRLEPGESRTFTPYDITGTPCIVTVCDLDLGFPQGGAIRITADPLNRISELDENNNRQVKVLPPRNFSMKGAFTFPSTGNPGLRVLTLPPEALRTLESSERGTRKVHPATPEKK